MVPDTRSLIDFTELISSVPGEGLEELTRQLGKNIGLATQWSGRGADGGRDLIFTESLQGPIGRERLRWVVSCKDKATSGAAVNERDLPSIMDKVLQHHAHGFLLVTTTTVSSSAKQLLDALNKPNGGDIHTLVWDSSELVNLLLKPENENCLKQFLPESYKRVMSLTTIDTALETIRRSVPTGVYEQIVKLVVEHKTLEFSGLLIWPYDHDTAQVIEHIARAVVDDKDIPTAVALTEDVEFDALLAFTSWLYKRDPGLHYAYLSSIAVDSDDDAHRYNAVQLLLDHHEVSASEWIHLASSLDNESLSNLFSAEIVAFAVDMIYGGLPESEELEFSQQLFALCEAYDIDAIKVTHVSFSIENAQAINFEGQFTINTTLWRESGSMNRAQFDGTFLGFFNEFGIFMRSLRIDTVPALREISDT